jgi:hypothetical protein
MIFAKISRTDAIRKLNLQIIFLCIGKVILLEAVTKIVSQQNNCISQMNKA